MADGPSGGGEKTEAPTAKRLQDSAKKGDVLQSKELGAALVVAAGGAAFLLMGNALMDALTELVAEGLSLEQTEILEFDLRSQLNQLLKVIIGPLLALFGVTIIAAIATPVFLGSLGFRWSAMKPKGEKLNPINGLKRMFGTRGLIELVKSLAKVVALGTIGLWLVYSSLPDMFTLGSQPFPAAVDRFGELFVMIFLALSGGLFLIAAIDVPAQLTQRNKRLLMTKQEVKDEHKEVEGSPEAKAAQRSRQQQILSQSARNAMQEATVVLTNPTHFAIALRYRPGHDAVPLVLARGRGETALAMRELAEERTVPMLQYPALTRAIYFTTPVGQNIDERLYISVATILAFLFRLDAKIANETDRPEIELPDDLKFDENGSLKSSI